MRPYRFSCFLLPILALALVTAVPSAATLAQSEATHPGDSFIPNDFDESMASSDFAVAGEMVTKEEATEATMVASIFSAVCAGVPALLLGIIIGLLVGRRKPSDPSLSSDG